MSLFLEFFRFIFCCGEETSDVWNDETSYRSPSQECLLRRPDPTTMYYTNLGVNSSSGEGKSSVSSLYEVVVDTGRSESYFSKSLKTTKEAVPQKSNLRGSSSILPDSLSKSFASYSNLSNLSPKVPLGSSRPSMPTTTFQKNSSKSSAPASNPPPHSKVTLSKISSNSTGKGEKLNYRWVPKGESPFYAIPEDIEALTTMYYPNLGVNSSSGEGKSYVSSLYEVVVDTGRSESDKEVVPQKSNLRGSSSILPDSLSKPFASYSNLSNLSPKVPIGSSRPSMPTTTFQKISSKSSAPSSNPLPHSKVTLSKISSNSMGKGEKLNYRWVPKGESPFYAIPEDIEALMRKDLVPVILKKALTPTTYKDYFAALLYAEDFHTKKWSNFKLVNVTLELQEAVIHKMSDRNSYIDDNYKKEEKILVAFEIDSVRENRPFLISRDFVFARPSGKGVLPFQGFVYQVRKSTRVLVEFGEDFLSQHHSTRKYDVSFSFNRVCLKRAHQAVADASDILFQNFLFPDHISRKSIALSPPPLHNVMDPDVRSVACQMSSFRAAPPYLVEGPLCVPKGRRDKSDSNQLSKTGLAVQEAVVQIYRSSPACRILICAPTNGTCDALEANLMMYIPESDMFRANAAFRGIDEEPNEILLSRQNGEEHGGFSLPPLDELREFRMIVSTFMSSFRLHNEGIVAGHFSHLFLVDASSATEPELMVALANFANQKTAVVVTGAPGDRTKWVRSDIAKRHGLTKSYFERLCESNPYKNLDPEFIGVI